MNPTDIAPVRNAPTKGAGRSSKGEDSAEDAGDNGFARTMKQVVNGRKQPTAAVRQPGHAQGMADVRARFLEAVKSERNEPAAGDGQITSEGQSGDDERVERQDGEAVGSEPGTAGLRGTHDVLALMMAHGNGHATRRDGEVPSALANDSDPQPGLPKTDAAAALEKLNLVSMKLETHLAQNAAPVSAETAQKLAQLGNGRVGATAKAFEPTVATKASTPGEPRADAKAHDAEATDAMLRVNGQPGTALDANQRGNGALAGGDPGGKGDPKSALREPASAEPANPVADKAASTVPTGSPMEQLAPRLLDTAREMKAVDPAAATASTSAAATPAAGPMRVLSIDLHPADLGSLTVRMSLAGDTLGVHIEAERPETARLLQNDASALSDMLRTAGVQVDGVTVRAAQMDTVSGGTGTGQSFMQDNSQSQPGGAQADARASGGNGRGQDRQPSGESRQDQSQNGQQRSQRSTGSGLYV